MKRTLGWAVLASFAVSYLGILFIGRRSMAVAVPGFLLTFAFGIRVALLRRTQRSRSPSAAGTRPPWLFGALLFGAVVTILGSLLTLDHFSRGSGVADVRDGGLLRARERYLLTSRRGREQEVERWRYLTVGLLFHTIWYSFATTAAVVVLLDGDLSGSR